MGFETNGGSAKEKEMMKRNEVIGEDKDSDHTEMNSISEEKKSWDNNRE
jgi:hypothetical protein